MARAKDKADIVKPKGVGLKDSEWRELEQIADKAGLKLHAITAYAVRYFLRDYRAGKIKPEKKTVQSLPDL
jgi:hypothetical protein